MKSIPRLIDAVCQAYHMALPGEKWAPIFTDERVFTFCNESFNYICQKMGYFGFDKPTTERPTGALLANHMFEKMNDPNGDWMDIGDVNVVQYHANEGVLTAAIHKNYSGPGHVCAVIPGELEMSRSWGMLAPKVMNVGKEVFIGKKASFAFRREDMPRYFCLKAML